MIIYIAERWNWDGMQDYELFATEELANQFVERQDKRYKSQWGVVEKEVGSPG